MENASCLFSGHKVRGAVLCVTDGTKSFEQTEKSKLLSPKLIQVVENTV